MIESRFWQDLGKKFRALKNIDRLRAEWSHQVGSGHRQWTVTGGTGTATIWFEALARRGAAALRSPGDSDLFVAWLEALRVGSGNSRFKMERHGVEQDADGTEGVHHLTGFIFNVREVSINYCSEREGDAREAEIRKKLQAREDRTKTSEIVHSSAESAGRQIDRYRKELQMTEEELAEQMKIATRTVQRHTADACQPFSRHLVGYSRLFTRLLKRQIVIKKMS